MKSIFILLFGLTLISCASTPKKEYEYVLASGDLATPEKISEVKLKCDYDLKMEEAKGHIGTAMSIGRYESQYNKSSSQAYTKKASDLMYEATVCIKENGLHSREKVKP